MFAMGHVFFVGDTDLPKEIPDSDVECELKLARLIMSHLPRLKNYPNIRLDFGPNLRLNEIEILQDMFGGPGNNCQGEKWDRFVQACVKGIITDTDQLLASLH